MKKQELIKKLKIVKRGKYFVFDMDIFSTEWEFTFMGINKIDNLLFKSMMGNSGTGGRGTSCFVSWEYDKKGIEEVQPLLEEIIMDKRTFRKVKF